MPHHEGHLDIRVKVAQDFEVVPGRSSIEGVMQSYRSFIAGFPGTKARGGRRAHSRGAHDVVRYELEVAKQPAHTRRVSEAAPIQRSCVIGETLVVRARLRMTKQNQRLHRVFSEQNPVGMALWE